jgi:glycosyltransferase involved in cell wall biosynthesis
MPKLSIITINYNNVSGLRKTIKSVVSQTSQDFEYIIIDGGSKDGSVEVIKSFTDIAQGIYKEVMVEVKQCAPSSELRALNSEPDTLDPIPHAPCSMPISFWISEPDYGIYHAMNKGIMAAKGDYCQFLNSGDWLVSKDVIGKMLASLPDCGIYYGNMLKQMPNSKIFRDTCEKGNLTMLSFYRGSLNHSPALIKHSLFDKYGLYDESLKIVSDWKWYLNVVGLNNEHIKYINLDIAYFDMNGISNTNHELEKQERRKVIEELLPAKILADYDSNWRKIYQFDRINHYKITKWIFSFIERVLFKWEKIAQKSF